MIYSARSFTGSILPDFAPDYAGHYLVRAIPEPSSLALLCAGCTALFACRRRTVA